MPSSPHPLEALIGPIRFACARDFANLAQVKGLQPLVLGALERSRSRLSATRLEALSLGAQHADALDVTVRKKALLAIAGVLVEEGLNVGFPLPASAIARVRALSILSQRLARS